MQTHEWCKVLIVDDELLIRQGIKHYINWEEEGFRIVGEASNGLEALELIESTQPHIVITDMVMPVMDGGQLTRRIKEIYPHIEVIILSSFGDFDYVRSTFQHGVFDYILKPQLEGPNLLKALQEAAAKIPSFTLNTKRKGKPMVSIERILEEMMSGYEIDDHDSIIQEKFPYSNYCLLGIDFKNRINEKQGDNRLLAEETEQRLNQGLRHTVVQHLINDENIAVYLLNFEQSQLQAIRQFIKENSKVPLFFDNGVGWALTEPLQQIEEVREIYEQKLLSLIQYRFYLPEMPTLIFDEVPNVPQIDNPFQLTKFTETFKRRQFDEAFLYLENHINIRAQQYTTDEFEFKSFLGNIIFNVTILLENMEYEHEQLEKAKYSYIASLDESLNAQKALSVFNDFLTEAKIVIEEHLVNSHDPKMQRLLEYIDKHYAEPLNLTEMANHFHYNPSYLSNYFSENNQQGFSEYLTQVRIRKSVELLENGSKPIAEVSALVGYSDHSYFCRVFKNSMGTSPSSYRRQYFQARKKHG